MLPLLFYFMKVEDGILECMCKVAHDQSEELGVDVVDYFWIYIMICMDEVIGASEIVNTETGLAYDDQFMLFKIGSEPSIIQGEYIRV